MELHEKWPHRWRSRKVESYQSPIEGWGIRAREDIPAGEIVFAYGGIVVPRSEIVEYRKILGHIGIQVSDDFFIVPTSHEEVEAQGIVNHSCEPNLGFKSQVELVTIRDIKKGEELTFDYAFSESFFPDDAFECHCGSPNCRKGVTDQDWKLPDVRAKYLNHFSPYLRTKPN